MTSIRSTSPSAVISDSAKSLWSSAIRILTALSVGGLERIGHRLNRRDNACSPDFSAFLPGSSGTGARGGTAPFTTSLQPQGLKSSDSALYQVDAVCGNRMTASPVALEAVVLDPHPIWLEAIEIVL